MPRRQPALGYAWCAALLAGPLVAAAHGLEPQRVTFPAGDALRIQADYYPPPVTARGDAPIALLLHADQGSRRDWEPLLAPLHEAGFAILAPDLRGHGESATTDTRDRLERRDPQLFRDMQEDLRGAYDWLATQEHVDRARFVVFAAGASCSVALQYAARDRSVDALVALGPTLSEYGLDPAGDVAQIIGRRIELVASATQRDAARTLQQRAPAAEVRSVSGDAAAAGLLAADAGLPAALAHLAADAAGKSSETLVYGSINSDVYHKPGSAWLAEISPTNLRYYSSPQEAESRGLRASRSAGPKDRSRGRREKP